MNPRLIHSRALHAILFLLMCGLSACVQTASVEPVTMNNPLLADPRPWCIGRLIIDRPARSEVSYEKYEYWGDKIAVASNVSTPAFQRKVNMREGELRTEKRIMSVPLTDEMIRNGGNGLERTDVPWLDQAVSPTPNSRLLIFKQAAAADRLFTQEGYLLAGSTMLTMTSGLRPDDIQDSIRLTTDEYRHITYRDDWTVPTERGFCIKGALIGGPSRNSELAEQTLVLQPGRPSAFVIKMRDAVDVDQQSSLLKTLPDLRRDLKAQGNSRNVQIVREGRRQIAGMDAEEVLFSIREGNLQLFRFYLIAPGNPDSTAQPHTEIQLILGSASHSTLPPDQATSPVDEAGAIQVWDTLLNSMRLRPGAM